MFQRGNRAVAGCGDVEPRRRAYQGVVVSIDVHPFVDVKARVSELGCQVPTGLALLPRNFETAQSRDELVHDASGLSLRAAWRSEGVPETRLEPEGERWPAGQQD